MTDNSFDTRVYRAVRRIPKGRVASYGDIALLAGSAGASQAVGNSLAKLGPGERPDVPWWRVIPASGKLPSKSHLDELRRLYLETEGVRLSSGAVSWEKYGCLLRNE